MRGERTPVPETLIGRYGLSHRLAARVVALLAKKVDFSPTLLEMAASDTALEALLLDRSLLTEPQGLGQEQLRQKGGAAGFRDAELLRVVDGEEGWRTVALDDDVLAEEAQAAGPGASGAGVELIRVGEAGMSRAETEGLFTPEEIARLKLSALTSQSNQERIEALRKLVFAPLAASQKVGIFVGALIDAAADAEVRREAVQCLQRIGFRADLAEAIQGLFQAQDEEVLYAVRRVGALLRETQEAEAGVTLAVILEILDETDRVQVIAELLDLAAKSAAILARSPQKTELFIQSMLRHLTMNFGVLRVPSERAIRACWQEAPELVHDVLWHEIDRSAEPRVRAFLARILASVVTDHDELARLAKVAVAEFVNPKVPEEERTDLRYALVRMGDGAVHAALERLRGATGTAAAELVRVLDVICAEGHVTEDAANAAAETLMELLQVGDQWTRRRVLDAAVVSDARVSAPLRAKVASELLAHIGEFRLPATLDNISRNLERIGVPALVPLFEYVKKRYPHDDAERGFLTLSRIVRAHGSEAPDEFTLELIDHCMKLLMSPGARRGAFTITLACACGYTRPGVKAFGPALAAMKDRLDNARYTADIFDALGIMAGSDNVKSAQQEELFGMFRHILNARAPDLQGVKRKTGDGTVYEFGREVLFDTRVVPAVVQGLERICVSPCATLAVREEVVKELMVLWEGVSNVRVVWGPGAVEALIRAVASAARCPEVGPEVRVRLGRSLLRFLNKVGVVRSIGEICAMPHVSEHLAELSLEAAEKLLSEWERSEQQDDERRAALLRSLGQIAANTSLDKDDERVKRMRENVLDVLFRGLREGVPEVKDPLELLRNCPALTQAQRDAVAERLGHAYGLLRIRRE